MCVHISYNYTHTHIYIYIYNYVYEYLYVFIYVYIVYIYSYLYIFMHEQFFTGMIYNLYFVKNIIPVKIYMNILQNNFFLRRDF